MRTLLGQRDADAIPERLDATDGEPLRVLFVTPYYKPYLGGIERAIEQLARQLAARGHEVGVLTTSFAFPRRFVPGLPERDTIDDGVRVYRVPGWPHRAPPCFSVPLVWFAPGAIDRALEEFRPDVVHWVGDGWFWAHAWTWRHAREHAGHVFTPSFHHLRPAYRWLQPINVLLSRAADRVTALSSVERRALRRTYRVPGSRLEEIPWGVDDPLRAPAPPRGWEPRALTVLCVGRLGAHKGQDWLLDRALAVRATLPRPLRLVLVGRDEGGAAALRERVRREGLEDLVLLTGEVDDAELARWYAHADLFALFSEYEAYGLVYLEAMSYGLPVLTHDVGAVRETVREGGVVVPRFDAAATERALRALLTDDATRLRLSLAARAHAAGLSWAETAARFLDTYRRACLGKTPWPGAAPAPASGPRTRRSLAP
ncbi:MAG TPA: glycosyltransferase family 4 protein [Mycobacteriales bacterium]|nr:glycosyltransferase family 4 protein [Mycobacteriales bacterium]